MPRITRPTRPPAPCRLPHHTVGSRVQWTHTRTGKGTGTVQAHTDDRIITIRPDNGGPTFYTSCGHVTPESNNQ